MLIDYLIKKSDFSTLSRFVSPSFFRVVSLTATAKIINQFRVNQSRHEAWERVLSSLQAKIVGSELNVILTGRQPAKSAPVESGDIAKSALELFFFQILTSHDWVIDFGMSAFSQNAVSVLFWQPRHYFIRPSDDFALSVRNLYLGFYTEKDELFKSALQNLGLAHAEMAFRRHFGINEQRQVRFSLAEFQATFANVFELCAEQRSVLHPEFFLLGAMLLGLYEFLEHFACAFDVRSAFNAAHSGATRAGCNIPMAQL
jgi:hypothetical protein